MKADKLSNEVQYIKGVGPERAKLLEKLGVRTVADLLYYFPRTWVDRTVIKKIKDLRLGEKETIRGIVLAKQTRQVSARLKITTVMVQDESGSINCIWYNQPYMEKVFKKGDSIICHGKIELFRNFLQISNPEYEIITGDDDNISVNRIVPVYSLTDRLYQKSLRKIIKFALDKYIDCVDEYLPETLRMKDSLIDVNKAILNAHFPEDFDTLNKAKKRLIFDEFFFLQMAFAIRKKNIKEKSGIVFNTEPETYAAFESAMPFSLTGAQKRVVEEIKADFKSGRPMNRLIQGDVGSGKTVVAFIAAAITCGNGCQTAFMAPTEILAQQHARNAENYFKSTGIRHELLTSDTKKQKRDEILARIKNGDIGIIIGTHALIQEDVGFKNMGLVIIDEQHRFGVMQRAELLKKGAMPHTLIMSATPIPRTLSLTVYGDTDISIIDEMPPSRKAVKTVLFAENETEKLYTFIEARLNEGAQVYAVYPLVEESEKIDLKSAIEMEKQWAKRFGNYKVALIHGRMKKEEKDSVMQDFKNKAVNILVSTTVIEVGIDVANATVMVIEHADRFGLSQLHQLRGRVGRGYVQSYCILLGDPKTEEGMKRLNIMVSTQDGFKIAEEDLALRGPGEFMGVRQHGVPEFKIANIITDRDIMETSRQAAFGIVSGEYVISSKEKTKLLGMINIKYGRDFELVNVG